VRAATSLFLIALGLLADSSAVGQNSAVNTAGPKKTWSPRRTLDGQPDLQGVWSIATVTPLERPPELADKVFLTAEEAANFEKETRQKALNRDFVPYNEVWYERAQVVGTRRTSLIVDPQDGKIPPLTLEMRKKIEDNRNYERLHPSDGPERLSSWERCITRGLPMLPTGYNNSFQILQAPGYVVIAQEMVHEARIIPLDGRPHLSGRIRGYMGDSRGHWEGNTLIVDTTNFSDKNNFRTRDYPLDLFTPNLHLIERFVRVDANRIIYEFTIDDPAAFTSRWTAQIPMTAVDDPVLEYACHEGNYAITGILAGARAQERKSSQEQPKTSK
jgi:hypothetical protein